MSIKLTTGILLGLLILLPLTARSQPGAFFGPHLGIQKSQDAEDASYLAGATIRIKLNPILGIEGDIGYRQEKYGSGALTVREWPATVTGLLYPLPIIYGGIGGGWYNSTLDYSDDLNDVGIEDDTATKFGWHLVVGIELPASPKLKLFGDVRYVFLDRKLKNLPDAVLEGDDANFYSINVGLLFRI